MQKTCDQNNWRNHLEDAGQNMKDAGQKIGGGNISHLFFSHLEDPKKHLEDARKKHFYEEKNWRMQKTLGSKHLEGAKKNTFLGCEENKFDQNIWGMQSRRKI